MNRIELHKKAMKNTSIIVEVITNRFAGYVDGYWDDMFQEGYIALAEATAYVEGNTDTKEFRSYAEQKIRNTLYEYLKKYGYRAVSKKSQTKYSGEVINHFEIPVCASTLRALKANPHNIYTEDLSESQFENVDEGRVLNA